MVVPPVKPTKEENKPHVLLEEPPWREHVARQTPREQEVIRTLALASVEAYMEFVGSLFSYYEAVTGIPKESRGEDNEPKPR